MWRSVKAKISRRTSRNCTHSTDYNIVFQTQYCNELFQAYFRWIELTDFSYLFVSKDQLLRPNLVVALEAIRVLTDIKEIQLILVEKCQWGRHSQLVRRFLFKEPSTQGRSLVGRSLRCCWQQPPKSVFLFLIMIKLKTCQTFLPSLCLTRGGVKFIVRKVVTKDLLTAFFTVIVWNACSR